MISPFNFSEEEILTFFAVLVRYSVLIAVLPFVGDKAVPTPAKILLSVAVTLALFPALVAGGSVRPGEAIAWGATAGGILGTVALEVLFGLALGFTAKLAFDSVFFGANLVGNFMGFASAATYDPHQESQTQVIAEFQMALAMLIFLVLDGHHLMLRAGLESYQIVGLGKAGLGAVFAQRMVTLTGNVLKFGLVLAAPLAVSLFAVNVAFGVLAKAMPQLNILVLSFSVTAIVGFFALFLTLGEFQGALGIVFSRMEDAMAGVTAAMAGR